MTTEPLVKFIQRLVESLPRRQREQFILELIAKYQHIKQGQP